MNIKRWFIVGVIGLLMGRSVLQADCDSCKCDPLSKTYFAVHPYFSPASPERVAGFYEDRVHARSAGIHGALQAVVFGGKSTGRSHLATYFSPVCKPCLQVREQVGQTFDNSTDLLSSNFNITTATGSFSSVISFAPRQSTAAFALDYRQAFCRQERNGYDTDFWVRVSLPIVHVSNTMGLCENVLDDGDGVLTTTDATFVPNMTAALSQASWCFGKIDNCSHKKTRVADIELDLGYEWWHEMCHLETYLGVIIPTGNKAKGHLMFEPIVGNGHHSGLAWGARASTELWHCEEKDYRLGIEWAGHCQYLFRNKQVRSFDLKNKPWSRYLEVYSSLEQAEIAASTANPYLSTPGINVFTQQMHVTPGFSYTMNCASIFTVCSWEMEAGYNLYARRAECVKLVCDFPAEIAIKAGAGGGATNPVRTINGNSILERTTNNVPVADYSQSVLTLNDVDLVSAAHPAALSHTVYGAAGYHYEICDDFPLFGQIGGSYEFASKTNAAIDRWTVWGKVGVSF